MRFFQPDYTIAVVLIGDSTNGSSPGLPMPQWIVSAKLGKSKGKLHFSIPDKCEYRVEICRRYVYLDLQRQSQIFTTLGTIHKGRPHREGGGGSPKADIVREVAWI